jgi:capsular polysaccharide export protein
LKRGFERKAKAAIENLAEKPGPLFFFPFQLDCDYQTRVHSPFRAMHLAMEHVLVSFARHAPNPARMFVKLHPLDSGIIDWRAVTGHIGAELGIADRLIVVDGGDIDKILARCRAVVTLNSTVGGLALACRLPVIALGNAVYDIAGLTHQGELDEFWRAPKPPDGDLFDAFRRVLAARCLIPGSFFSEAGLKLAVEAALDRLEAIYFRPARGFIPKIADGSGNARPFAA